MSADALSSSLRETNSWSEDLLARLVACPSVTGEPSEIMSILAPALEDFMFEVDVIPVDPRVHVADPEYSPPDRVRGDQAPVLHARYRGETHRDPCGRGDLLLFAHTDTEPVHHGWKSDPYQLRVDTGRATGLGVADDKAGVVSILAAVRAVRASEMTMTWRPRVVLGSGKQGGALGILPGTRSAARVAAAVYCHPAESSLGHAQLKVGSRGIVQLEVKVEGVTSAPSEVGNPVSADPRLGRNAAVRAARLATGVTAIDRGDLVCAVTALAAGTHAFEVPESALLLLACWFEIGDVDSVVLECERMLQSLAIDDWERNHPPAVGMIGLRGNPASCSASPFARWSSEIIGEVTGARVEEYSWHSASDIRFPMRCLGVPAVGFGGKAGGFYGPEEWVDLASMHASTEILARMLTCEARP